MRRMIFVKRVFSLAIVAIFVLPSLAFGWDKGHRKVSLAAYAQQPSGLRSLWSAIHQDPFDSVSRPILEYLVEYELWTGNPDLFEGVPDFISLKGAQYIGNFYYAETMEGTQCAPIPPNSGVPDNEWSYHYFGFSEEENIARSYRGAKWYFQKIVDAFVAGQHASAATYAATFAHAIEDRSSPVHAWDGYASEREALEAAYASYGLQDPNKSFRDNPTSWSLFWFGADVDVEVNISDYSPKMLGVIVNDAALAFSARFQHISDNSRMILSDPNRFLGVHLRDDWVAKVSGPETLAFMNEMAAESARLVADVFYTAYKLYREQVPEPTKAVKVVDYNSVFEKTLFLIEYVTGRDTHGRTIRAGIACIADGKIKAGFVGADGEWIGTTYTTPETETGFVELFMQKPLYATSSPVSLYLDGFSAGMTIMNDDSAFAVVGNTQIQKCRFGTIGDSGTNVPAGVVNIVGASCGNLGDSAHR